MRGCDRTPAGLFFNLIAIQIQYLRQIYELLEQGSAGWMRPRLVTLWKIFARKIGSGFSAYEFYSFLNIFITSEMQSRKSTAIFKGFKMILTAC
jgi:hypothetical protein